ncbi:MAG: FHA domain-containing protein [Prevotella sp.]|nr:FHA domain-containing protein [Prevotella sp.]
MKRLRCPKCDEFIRFDETQYEEGQSLIFVCPSCGKQFGIKLKNSPKKDNKDNPLEEDSTIGSFGAIIVIENVFHYKQILPLKLGDNSIGRYMKGSKTNLQIETSDPSIDTFHCTINVSRDKRGGLKYVLRDAPSNTGTFVDNEILGDRERRVLTEGSLFTIGATSIILKSPKPEE